MLWKILLAVGNEQRCSFQHCYAYTCDQRASCKEAGVWRDGVDIDG